jgi:surfactin synthase thioesterase subunit
MMPFVRPCPVDNPTVRLIAFHHAAGSSSSYFGLKSFIPADWDLLLHDLPGRGKRFHEDPLTTMPSIVARALEDVRPWLNMPVALFGHSLGAIVASEVGRACESFGAPPIWLGVSGRVGPAHRLKRRRLHELDDDALLRELLELGGTPAQIAETPEFVAQLLRTARADLAAVASYAPAVDRPKSRFPVTAFAGTSDPLAPPFAMRCWEQETNASFRLRQFSGGHFYFLGGALAALTQTIISEIERDHIPVVS